MKNVLITGAGRGIGLALTREFLEHGFQVLGTYRDERSARELLSLAKAQSNLKLATADVTTEKSLGPLREQLKKFGSLDILINNSGVIGQMANGLKNLDFDQVGNTFAVNTLGPMRISQLAIPFMKTGTIAHITSLMGSIKDNESGGYYDYRMSKAALNMFNKSLSKEFPSLTCLVLHPGWVQTDMGGAGATVPVVDSARGLFTVIVEAKKSQSGHFYDFRGKELPW